MIRLLQAMNNSTVVFLYKVRLHSNKNKPSTATQEGESHHGNVE